MTMCYSTLNPNPQFRSDMLTDQSRLDLFTNQDYMKRSKCAYILISIMNASLECVALFMPEISKARSPL